jgi:hypothetical protein
MISTDADLDKLAELKALLATLKAQFARKLIAAKALPSFPRSSEKRAFRMQKLRKAQFESNKIERLIKGIEESLCSKKL